MQSYTYDLEGTNVVSV